MTPDQVHQSESSARAFSAVLTGRVGREDATRRRLWITASMVLLVVGIVGSTVGGILWASYQRTQTAQSFHTTASTVAASLRSSVNRDLDFQAVLESMIASTPGLTNRQLAPWLKALDVPKRYPGTLGFGFFEPISAAQLPAFLSTVQADPRIGAPPGPITVYPPGLRAQYCLSRLGFLSVPNALLADLNGIDICALTQPGMPALATPATYRRVIDTGQPAVVGLASSLRSSEAKKLGISGTALQSLKDLVVVIDPLYRGGTTPATARARTQASIGWLVGSFSAKSLFGQVLSGNSGVALRVRSGKGASVSLLASEGPAVPGAHLTITKRVATSPLVSVVVVGSVSSGGPVQGTILGGIGAALSAILFLFLFHLGRSREHAQRLVAQRTRQLHHLALHDSLTELPNRALILDRIDQMLARSRREHTPVAVLFLDLDNFKDINDTLGHAAGDQLLTAVAARLTSAIREEDTVGRLGGDEFVVLAEGTSLAAGAEMVAERILDVLATPFKITGSDAPLTVTASIGIAEGRRDTPDELLRDADVALYQAKAAGKKCAVVFAPAMQIAVDDSRNLEKDLHAAFEDNQFFLLYQPTFDLASGALTGVEALLRWRHPTRGVIQPDDFIPALEASGLIVPVGRWVLEEACQQGATWHRQGHHITVSINVSARQLDRDQIVTDVHHALTTSGFDPALCVLELTETTLMHNVEDTVGRLTLLKALGVRLAIDDFGTGYSSLAYLQQFPIDVLKIDRSFVSSITDTSEAVALVHAMVQLGKALGLETVAEGVENDGQRVRLTAENIDTAQGFLFARPLDVEAVDQLLAESPHTYSAYLNRPGRPERHVAERHL
jgi:diguanylate cyclase (GGDEF)-like protein